LKLKDILACCETAGIRGDAGIDISDIVIDSRKVKPGALFVCISGTKLDGHAYAGQAAEKGAAALVVEHFLDDTGLPQALVHDSREALARLAGAFYGDPAKRLSIVGVTGTNGKTTTTYMLKSIFEAAGEKVGLMGTIATMVGDEVLPQTLTTPDPMEFHAALRKMADAGCGRVVMEVSAHALALRKMAGVVFDASIFTNLTQDHLDDFITMENYSGAKKLLFTGEYSRAAVVNADDPACAFISEGFGGRLLTYGVHSPADIRAEDTDVRPDGASYTMTYEGTATPIRLKLSGHFNIYNALGAAGAAMLLGVAPETLKTGLERIERMDGRMERVETGSDFTVLVDYAHTPDSIQNVLRAARVFARNRVVIVFGCGGDRDRTKRPAMGRLAGELADYVVLTSDNPRTEEPESIIDMIEPGLKGCNTPWVREADRHAAIGRALGEAKPGDVVIIAGKGHETYQDVMGVKRHFDDREVAREWLEKLQGRIV
jgi:UDP-N-acetylmuramoyl-L-alanyl-D-glutamate--2,6-diaminopimelate ligase